MYLTTNTVIHRVCILGRGNITIFKRNETWPNNRDTASLIAVRKKDSQPEEERFSTRSCFLLLEYHSIDWNTHSNAEDSEHCEAHFQLLVCHPVQVIHVLSMQVVRFIMTMCSHSLHLS